MAYTGDTFVIIIIIIIISSSSSSSISSLVVYYIYVNRGRRVIGIFGSPVFVKNPDGTYI